MLKCVRPTSSRNKGNAAPVLGGSRRLRGSVKSLRTQKQKDRLEMGKAAHQLITDRSKEKMPNLIFLNKPCGSLKLFIHAF
jgi:hypothetical protein